MNKKDKVKVFEKEFLYIKDADIRKDAEYLIGSLPDYYFAGSIPTRTTSEITKEYRLRIWINDDIVISDSERNASYTQAQFNNLFANFNITVESYDELIQPTTTP